MNIYLIFLVLHNLMRWVVTVLAIAALYRSITGWLQKKDWTSADRKVGVFYGASIDTQLLLGLILYFLISPWGLKAVLEHGLAYVLANSIYRFFVVEHFFYMLLAVVFAHLGTMLPKKVEEAAQKHKRAAILFGLSVLMILLGMPWGRPLLPGM